MSVLEWVDELHATQSMLEAAAQPFPALLHRRTFRRPCCRCAIWNEGLTAVKPCDRNMGWRSQVPQPQPNSALCTLPASVPLAHAHSACKDARRGRLERHGLLLLLRLGPHTLLPLLLDPTRRCSCTAGARGAAGSESDAVNASDGIHASTLTLSSRRDRPGLILSTRPCHSSSR